MKNTDSKSRRLEKQVRNLRERITGLSDEVGDLSDYLEESRDLLYDIKEILKDKLIIGEPTSSGEVLRIWKQRDPFDNERSARVAIISAWNEAFELRALCSKLQPRCSSDLSDWFEQAQRRLPTFSPPWEEIVFSPILEMVLLRRAENSHLSQSKRRGSQQPRYERC
jgi:hypothetical protein